MGTFYLWIKAIHLIFVVALMAGMLMYPRLKIYQLSAKPGSDLFEAMRKAADRLRLIILNPSLIIVWLLGIYMLYLGDWALLKQPWMQVKLVFVLVITSFHGIFISMGKKIDKADGSISEKRLRMMNEIPFVAMIVVIIMVIVKPF